MPRELTVGLALLLEGGGRWSTSCLVVEDAPEVVSVREDVGLVGEIRTAGVYEVDAWQP